MAIQALLLDLDGTLVDSNRAHAQAFVEAFAERGYAVQEHDVMRQIGKGGDLLVPGLVGEEGERRDGDAIRKAKKKAFDRIVRACPLSVCNGAEALVEVARARGLRIALCTAAEEADLETIFESAGVDFRPRFDAVTTTTDVDEPKPNPDVVEAAAEMLGVPPSACALVGDTIYDGQTARRAGAAFIGVLTGPWTEAELRAAGALAVFADAGELAGNLAMLTSATSGAGGGA